MSQLVVANAQLQCPFGIAPSTLGVVPMGPSLNQSGGQFVATIQDFKPMVNIRPFGMCTTPSNPQVAAATAAALGVLTPQPCIPVTTAPWAPGSPTVMVGGQPALNNTSKCMCSWGGVISVVMPGQMSVTVP
jgi:uncharacterized Zn-binding protein involved in type VI secretion